MMSDYRNTKYCPKFENLKEKKKMVEEIIRADHAKGNLYILVRDNKKPYKKEFAKAYNCKCAYCGISTVIEPLKRLEIDHFINKSNKMYSNKSKVHCIDNLVLSCYECNRRKHGFDVVDEDCIKLHPDEDFINKVFYRDDDYYIRINASYIERNINDFYNKLELGSELRRIDYLLMSLKGFNKKVNLKVNENVKSKIYEIITILEEKRNNETNFRQTRNP